MSIVHTPPQGGTAPNNMSLENTVMENVWVCSICNEQMNEGQECLIINECSHSFHKLCIETHLATSNTCPVCQRPCQLAELRAINLNPFGARAPSRTKGRGAQNKHYNTRSHTRNLFPSIPNEFSSSNVEHATPVRSKTINQPGPNHSTKSPNSNTSIDYEHLTQMILAQLPALLQNVSLSNSKEPLHASNNTTSGVNRNSLPHTQEGSQNQTNHIPQQSQFSNSLPGLSGTALQANSTNSSFNIASSIPFHADKITSIIQNWHIKFDGSQSGLNVEEFLYRVRTLTNDTFSGDFSIICKNLHILLSGKARDWYWRYHKNVHAINWNDFCRDLKNQYKDFKSSFDIREEIRNRKQKPGEPFEVFFEAISTIMDRLASPISEPDLIEIITRNLRPEIRQDLLYIHIDSISHLRKLVQIRENFLNDEYVRRSLANKPLSYFPRKHVAEIELQDNTQENLSLNENSINAVQATPTLTKCWNCDEFGHHWEDCLEKKIIHCYGCGAKNILKPNCPKCCSKRITVSKNYQAPPARKD